VKAPARNGRLPAAWRWPAALAAAALAVLLALAAFPAAGNALGLGLHDGWFIDVRVLLAAGEAHARGLDVYVHNPLDLYGRPHSYPSVWLLLARLGLTRADTLWLGALLVVAVLAVAVAQLRPGSARAWAWSTAVLVSPPLLLGFVRSNNDLVIFLVLAGLGPLLSAEARGVRLLGAVPVALGAALKYYPAVAAVLLLEERDRRLRGWRAALLAALGALVAWSVREDLRHFATALPAPVGFYSFGAGQALMQLGVPGACRWLALAALLAVAWRQVRAAPAARPPLTSAERLFLLGATLLAGCFWAGMSWGYRWVFALWLLPALLSDDESELLPRAARPAWRWLLAFCLWWDAAGVLAWNLGVTPRLGLPLERYSEGWWFAGQPLTWLLLARLTLFSARCTLARLTRLRA
jgi:hypothetical protein